MSGTLFIVCIPTTDKEEIVKNTKIKENAKSEEHQSGSANPSNVAVCLPIPSSTKHDLEIGKCQEKFPLHRTRSCEIDESSLKLNVEAKKFSFRKSWDECRATKGNKISRQNSMSHEPDDLQLNISTDSTMEVVLRKIFEKLKIENATWQKCNGSFSVMFSVSNDIVHQQVLALFADWGIGERRGSSVSMIPCTVILPSKSFDNEHDEVFTEELSKRQGLWDKFMNSMNARMNVARIVEELRQDAALTFDFVTLIVIASIMAAFGLIENSIICLTSSMLISPLMRPLIAATFSTVIKDKQLMKFGVINELIGISLATLVGFVFGLIVGCVDERYGLGDGLGFEILSRCEIHSLVIGIFTAIPSGAALAIALLSKNIGSLVGVAISASLLPSAVNAGLLWAMAALFTFYEKNENLYNSVIKSTTYSENQALELLVLGSLSMALTIINVICIYVTCILFLKIKEVAPMVSKYQRQFWKHDVKVARDYNKTIGAGEGASTQEKLFEDFAQLQDNEFKNSYLKRAEHSVNLVSNQYTWSPMMSGPRTTRMTIREIENAYKNMSHTKTDKSHPTRVLSRVAALAKSVSPTKYQHLPNDTAPSNSQFSISFLNRAPPTSSTVLPQKICSKNNSSNGITEISQADIGNKHTQASVVQCNNITPRKSKFIVTPSAIDPLDLNKR